MSVGRTELPVASLRREGQVVVTASAWTLEIFSIVESDEGLGRAQGECSRVLGRNHRNKISGGISPLVQLHRTKVGKLRTLQEEENRRLELLEERSLQERAEIGGGHRASEYRGWQARVLHARRDHEL